MRISRVVTSTITLALTASIAIAGGETAFTYQGRLLDEGDPANGLFDLRFGLFSTESGGVPIGAVAPDKTSVTDGFFTVQIDFGADAFDNTERWLEITVSEITLSPRQPITRAPYAIQTRGMFIGDDGNVLFHSLIDAEGTVTVSSIGGIDLILEADTNNIGEDQNARIVMMQDGGQVVARMGYRENTNQLEIMQEYNSELILGTNNEDRLTILADGNVGIGTVDPSHPLEVHGDGDHTFEVRNTGALGITTAVWVLNSNDTTGSASIYGIATATSGSTSGVSGISQSTSGSGVIGHAGAVTGVNYGVVGQTDSPNGYGVFASGDFGGNGAKFFVQPHPYDPSKEIRFVCLEGNESGTYFRGSTQLVDGRAVIDVPEEFRLVTDADGLTVQVTAKGPNAGLWVETESLEQIIVRGNANARFNYLVNGVRRGFADHESIRENYAYVPEVRGVPYGTQFREGHRQILVQNGILNPDFTPNEATAAMMGWTLRDPEPEDQPIEETKPDSGGTK